MSEFKPETISNCNCKSDSEPESDDEFIIHPKKNVETLGTLAAHANSWYGNELEDGSDDSDDDTPTTGTIPAFPTIKATVPILPTVINHVDSNSNPNKRKYQDNTTASTTTSSFLEEDIQELITSAGNDNQLLNELVEYGEKLAQAAREQLKSQSIDSNSLKSKKLRNNISV